MMPTEQLTSALAERYAIERLIGEGGMATVYLARDVRHNRRVALKVLRPDLGAVVGIERFLAEIQVTANLQHPNLLPLFDSGAAGDLLFYVMPYVQGESLRARLDREKQLPIEEAIRLTAAIGGALDYAHRQGVIHRDLKPENVLLQEGQPLVADFGIALAVSNAGGTRITQTGLSLGTPSYMSPEQATGDRVIDGRTDIYSLGALAYEMLTGEPPHTGSTSQAIIARVLTERPRSIRVGRPSVPDHVEGAVQRALEKLPADRWASAHEFVEALTGARPVTTTLATGAVGVQTSPSITQRLTRRETAAWTLAVVAVALSVWSLTRPRSEAPSQATMRLDVELPDSIFLPGSPIATQYSLALSRDAQRFAFVGLRPTATLGVTLGAKRYLYIRESNDVTVRELPGTENASSPSFSPDGNWLAFADAQRTLKKVPVSGGAAQRLADSAVSVFWGDDESVYYSRGRAIWVVSSTGGVPRRVFEADSASRIAGVTHVNVIPRSRLALVTMRVPGAPIGIGLVDLDAGSVTDLKLTGAAPRFVAPDFVLYESEEGVLSAIRLSLRKREVVGTPVRVAEGLVGLGNSGADYAVSANGTVVFRWLRGAPFDTTQLALVNARGERTTLRLPVNHYDQPRLSADGRYAVVRISRGQYNTGDLWVLELASGALTRLTSNNSAYRASWSRDGTRIFYLTGTPASSRVMSKPWDGSGADSVLLDRTETAEFVEGPRGGWSAIRTYGLRDILLIPTDSIKTAQPRPFVVGPANETDVALSPSGRLMAYTSDETGRQEVYVRAVPGPGPRVPVSVTGGTSAVWSSDGATLFFRNYTHLMSARISETPKLVVTRRDSLFTVNLLDEGVNVAILPNDRGFLVATGRAARTVSMYRMAVLSNWQTLFSKREVTAP